MRETKPTICRICPAFCPILVTLEDGRAVAVTGDPEAPLYGGYSCPKGRALPEQHASPSRLLHSLKRAEHALERIASEQAVTEVAEATCSARLALAAPEMLRELAEVAAEDWRARHETPALPFRLIPRRSNFFVNSSGRSLPSLTHGKPFNPAHAHPEALAALGLASGAVVRIRSRHDAALAVIEADDTLRRGVVAMTHAFGGNPNEPESPRTLGTPLGRLLRDDDEYDLISGIPRMGALPVAIERVEEA